MENKDYVSFEQAKALKELGYDKPCRYFYGSDTGLNRNCSKCNFNHDQIHHNVDYVIKHGSIYSAPTLWEAQKWLREILMLHVGVCPAIPTRKWNFYIDDLNQHINPHDGELMNRVTEEMTEEYDSHFYDTYESALSSGISAALEILGKEGKR